MYCIFVYRIYIYIYITYKYIYIYKYIYNICIYNKLYVYIYIYIYLMIILNRKIYSIEKDVGYKAGKKIKPILYGTNFKEAAIHIIR